MELSEHKTSLENVGCLIQCRVGSWWSVHGGVYYVQKWVLHASKSHSSITNSTRHISIFHECCFRFKRFTVNPRWILHINVIWMSPKHKKAELWPLPLTMGDSIDFYNISDPWTPANHSHTLLKQSRYIVIAIYIKNKLYKLYSWEI